MTSAATANRFGGQSGGDAQSRRGASPSTRVPRGSALYIPPKPSHPDAECIDLHNNRNSARACWGHLGRESLVTDTLLQARNGFFHWYWNPKETVHTEPLARD